MQTGRKWTHKNYLERMQHSAPCSLLFLHTRVWHSRPMPGWQSPSIQDDPQPQPCACSPNEVQVSPYATRCAFPFIMSLTITTHMAIGPKFVATGWLCTLTS